MTGFLILATLTGMLWYLVVSLIGISLMANTTERLFMCIFAIPALSLMMCMLKSPTYFFIGLIVFLVLSFGNSLNTLDTSPLSDT